MGNSAQEFTLKMNLNITFFKFLLELPGTKELIWVVP